MSTGAAVIAMLFLMVEYTIVYFALYYVVKFFYNKYVLPRVLKKDVEKTADKPDEGETMKVYVIKR